MSVFKWVETNYPRLVKDLLNENDPKEVSARELSVMARASQGTKNR